MVLPFQNNNGNQLQHHSDEQLVAKTIRIVALFWIMMKLISMRLWLTERNYPLVPVIEFPAAIHIALYVVSLVLATWLILNAGHRKVMIALLFAEIIASAGDQTRFQPWHYQYIFTFFAIAANYNNKAKALQAILLITVATYLFSGIQKFNAGFLDSVWSVHMLKRFFKMPGYIIHNRFVHLSGFIIPVIEVSGAVGLLFGSTMKMAAKLLIAMHVFILIFLGPLGINYNTVVWPWNVQMIILLYLFFIKNSMLLRTVTCLSRPNLVIAVFWVALPLAGCFGYWDKFLSSGMYSGKGKFAQFYFANKQTIPPELRKYAFNSRTDSSARIVLTDWCVKELNVAAVTEPRVLKSIVRQLNERYAARHIVFQLSEAK